MSAGIPEPGTPVGYDEHIRPLFRENDREAMRFAFDLWSHADVSANATAIVEKLRAGAMPCDGAWPSRTSRALPPVDGHGDAGNNF